MVIILELAKLEVKLKVRDSMLKGWPRTKQDFLIRYKTKSGKPWCTPPEVIKVFWLAFLLGIIGVAVTACIHQHDVVALHLFVGFGFIFLALAGWELPKHFGVKFITLCEEEPPTWED